MVPIVELVAIRRFNQEALALEGLVHFDRPARTLHGTVRPGVARQDRELSSR